MRRATRRKASMMFGMCNQSHVKPCRCRTERGLGVMVDGAGPGMGNQVSAV